MSIFFIKNLKKEERSGNSMHLTHIIPTSKIANVKIKALSYIKLFFRVWVENYSAYFHHYHCCLLRSLATVVSMTQNE